MGGKNDAPPPPDYSGLIAANEKTSALAMKLARDQFDWAKQTYNENKDLMKQTGQSFLSTMENSRKAFEEDRARYKSQYQPMEDKLIRDARTYDTAERRDQEVGAAQANVAQQFDAARTNAQQQLESFGVNPSATRFAALDLGARTAEAATKAAAGTMAGKGVEDKGRALTAATVDIGRGYPNSYIAAAQVGNQAAGGAQQGANQTLQAGANAMGTGPQWLSGANQALGNWGDILNNQYQNQLSQFNANQSSGWGQVLGTVAGVGMKMYGFEEGGAVPPEASPSGGGRTDDVPVAVSVGEFVVPRETVSWLGEKHFHKLIEKTKEERSEAQAVPTGPVVAPPEGVQGYARGGMVSQPDIPGYQPPGDGFRPGPTIPGYRPPGEIEKPYPLPGIMPDIPGYQPPGGGRPPFISQPDIPGPGPLPVPPIRNPGWPDIPGYRPPGGGVRPLPPVWPTPGPPGGGMVPLPRGEYPTFPRRPGGPGWVRPPPRYTPAPPIPHYGPDPGRGVRMPLPTPTPHPWQDPRGVRMTPPPPIPHYADGGIVNPSRPYNSVQDWVNRSGVTVKDLAMRGQFGNVGWEGFKELGAKLSDWRGSPGSPRLVRRGR